MAATSGSRRVVIVGGGFAGLYAARSLWRAPVQVTVIDRADHHPLQPLPYQCSSGILSEGKIATPLRGSGDASEPGHPADTGMRSTRT